MPELELSGCTIHYRDSGGTGRAILFTHGAGADHVMFDAQYEFLSARGYRVVTWDQRGHGRSTSTRPITAARAVEDAEAVIDALKLTGAVLAGQSMGGPLSQELVRRHPDRYSGLVVMDSLWNAGPLSRSDRFWLSVAAPSLRLIPWRWLPGIMARASAVTPTAIADVERAFRLIDKRRFIDAWLVAVAMLRPERGYRTPVPLLLICGAEDRTGTISTVMPVWAAAEGVSEHVVAGAGHMVTQDAPDEVNALIQRFLNEEGLPD